MVATQAPQVDGLTFEIKPSHPLKRVSEKLHLPIPYFHFQKPKWKLIIKRVPDQTQAKTVLWYLCFSNGAITGIDQPIDVSHIKLGDKEEHEIGYRLISPLGTTSVRVSTDTRVEAAKQRTGKTSLPLQEIEFHTLCEFESVAEEEYFMPFFASFLGALIATLIGVLLGRYLLP